MRSSTTLLSLLLTASMQASWAFDPLSAINRADVNTVQWKIIGQCMFAPLVEHWIPLAWVETSPSGQQSFIDGVQATNSNTSVLRGSGLESSNAGRVFLFTNSLWRTSNIAISHGQMVCNVEDAMAASPTVSLPTAGCTDGRSIAMATTQHSVGSFASLAPFLTLSFDSSNDPGWTSGCRDAAKVDEATAANMRCETAMMSKELQPDSSASKTAAAKYCLGKWGSLIPRQSREIGLTGPSASAKTAYRAMSTARDHLGLFPYPVDAAGKMQLAAPNASPSFQPGSFPLPNSIQPNAERAYGWIYWRKVTCCAGGF